MFHTTFRPNQVHPSVFLAPGAVVVGDVTLSAECGVWFHASLRADVEAIWIGERTNIQEGAIFHADPGFPVHVGSGVTIGHGAIVHGATIGSNSVIGMRAVLLNGAVIGENSLVGAASLVTEGKVFPPGSLILGSPAKVIRSLSAEEIERNRYAAEIYVQRAQAFRRSAAPAQTGDSP
jgi:carbonic anhydrase/acetyltransferase-like protein (isoleucine patch superfamily)